MIEIWLAVFVFIIVTNSHILPIGASSSDRPPATTTGRMQQRASVLLTSTIGARETEASNDNTPSASSLLSPLSHLPYPFPSNSDQGKGGKDDPLLLFEAVDSTSSDGYPARTPVTLLEVNKIDDSIKTTSEWCNTLDSKFDDLTRNLDKLSDSMERLDRKIDTLTKQFEAADKLMDAWIKQLDTCIRIFTVILGIVLVLECVFVAWLFKLSRRAWHYDLVP